jgi:hypothetical protein
MTKPSLDQNTDETYLIQKYCLSRHHARRLLLSFGNNKTELERLLGANGRTQAHRSEDIKQTTAEVAFG